MFTRKTFLKHRGLFTRNEYSRISPNGAGMKASFKINRSAKPGGYGRKVCADGRWRAVRVYRPRSVNTIAPLFIDRRQTVKSPGRRDKQPGLGELQPCTLEVLTVIDSCQYIPDSLRERGNGSSLQSRGSAGLALGLTLCVSTLKPATIFRSNKKNGYCATVVRG